MRNFLSCLFLFVVCSCAFISCDDEWTLEEKKNALVGEWKLMDYPADYMETYIFNADGTAQIIHDDSISGKRVSDVTYRLEKEEDGENLYLFLMHEDMPNLHDFRYIEEFSSRKISMRLGIMTCDSPKYYQKVK